MEFLSFRPSKQHDTLYIEIVLDKYIKEQPLTDKEVITKVREYIPIINKIWEYPLTKKVIIIDCDKALEYQKINFVLGCKLMCRLNEHFGDPEKIYVIHSNTFMLSLFTGMRPLLPQSIVKLVTFS